MFSNKTEIYQDFIEIRVCSKFKKQLLIPFELKEVSLLIK